MSSPDAVYKVFVTNAATTFWLMDAILTNCSRKGSFWFGCPALGCGPWVGLLLRWSHSCLFVECPFLSPPPSPCPLAPKVPFLCLSCAPLFFVLLSQTSLPPQGVLAPRHLRKSDAFCDFSSWFFSWGLCARYCAGMHDGKWEAS